MIVGILHAFILVLGAVFIPNDLRHKFDDDFNKQIDLLEHKSLSKSNLHNQNHIQNEKIQINKPSYTKILSNFNILNQYLATFMAIGFIAMPLALIAPVMQNE